MDPGGGPGGRPNGTLFMGFLILWGGMGGMGGMRSYFFILYLLYFFIFVIFLCYYLFLIKSGTRPYGQPSPSKVGV